ncbi:putative isoaspartyl peptidase/L-asparaginase [Cyphellophora attinorum]|uniref:Putative isoaspartyl peptidase/L-asparaginase n=1 Tax=Cyphellophora attinorum TaxID=1664694 RepID=A0A0N1H8Y6_9EURO|nr:putative isoaspartyl peptidase/L-asparaginase [Phialophora attinorum]KPI39924.1 putative isoaspartyl peptidase/L-asparaginase [Phialophora attinorum]
MGIKYKPTLILHGGAGAISRANLPPDLYAQYHRSLLTYLVRTREKLDAGVTALDAAVYAVSLMEDDPLFNCGRGSVFNLDGEIEMEASVMVTSMQHADCASDSPQVGLLSSMEGQWPLRARMGGLKKRAAAVSMIQETRHPIQLARQVLLEGDCDDAGVRDMHCHLSGRPVEESGWNKGLERKSKDWFWTERRWKEHLRGLEKTDSTHQGLMDNGVLPSQGTVGAVCLDQNGNLAVATSTGGLTNKKPGRIGDTPTAGAGFFAESWYEEDCENAAIRGSTRFAEMSFPDFIPRALSDCIPILLFKPTNAFEPFYSHPSDIPSVHFNMRSDLRPHHTTSRRAAPRRAVAISGTGNGDSFLRLCAARTAASRCRYGGQSLATAVTAVAGTHGELQLSAGDRFGRTGEGEGGLIGIEIDSSGLSRTVFDFNCSAMWRAYYEVLDEKEVPKVMVFRDEYK